MRRVLIDGESLAIEDVVVVSRGGAQVEIPQRVKDKVKKCRRVVEQFVRKKKVVYGVTTGFGALGSVVVPSERIKELQSNMIRSHSAGVGKPLGRDVTRALMLLRANTLAKGNSGIRLETLETLVHMINKGVHPLIPEKGSVGASGDLAPLSHMTLVIMGEGEAEFEGEMMSGKVAMEKARIRPVELDFKEGLALNNGTQLMTALGALAVYDAERLIKNAEIAASLSLEALSGMSDAFDERIHQIRPHLGQIATARNVRLLTAESEIIKSGGEVVGEMGESKNRAPQDPYSLRCVPQVLGAARDAIAYARRVIETEINSATDNPLIFADDGECLSGGNFHGQPVSVAMDLLGIALAIIGNMSERRIARLIDENLSNGLPAFLIHRDVERGIHSGFMPAQVTAAALASENKALAHPASVDSIPTSANFEDFVSMGSIAARKATEILRNVETIVAIELLCAAQGVEFRGSEKLGRGTRVAYSVIRKKVPMLKEDRVMSKDIEAVMELVRSGELVEAVEEAVSSKIY
ncbi:MAG: histidine ammonia-lyase [Candidatus Bathyarchaeia archaeon]